ncbi:hypothetical protein SNE40_022630 [Patella caerulea]|uniref:Uncharacterized protein n=1 Tax=Patella caerulea TaxID=87958 RepID=A0AAN8G4G4_PATCE
MYRGMLIRVFFITVFVYTYCVGLSTANSTSIESSLVDNSDDPSASSSPTGSSLLDLSITATDSRIIDEVTTFMENSLESSYTTSESGLSNSGESNSPLESDSTVPLDNSSISPTMTLQSPVSSTPVPTSNNVLPSSDAATNMHPSTQDVDTATRTSAGISGSNFENTPLLQTVGSLSTRVISNSRLDLGSTELNVVPTESAVATSENGLSILETSYSLLDSGRTILNVLPSESSISTSPPNNPSISPTMTSSPVPTSSKILTSTAFPTVSPTTPTPVSKYPTEKPNLEKAYFDVELEITMDMNKEDFDEKNFNKFMIDLILEQCEICRTFILKNVRSGSVIVQGIVEVMADGVVKNKTESVKTLTQLTEYINTTKYMNTSMTYTGDSSHFVKLFADVCKAVGTVCSNWTYTCQENTCRSRCGNVSCGAHGICEFTKEILICRCSSDDIYNYYGDKCENSNIKWEILVSITVAVGVVLLIILTIAFICYCQRKKRMSQQEKGTENMSVHSVSSGVPDIPLQDKGDQEENELYDGRYFGKRYPNPLNQPSNYGYPITLGPPRGDYLDIKERESRHSSVSSAYQSKFGHINPHADYRIKRPQLVLRPGKGPGLGLR